MSSLSHNDFSEEEVKNSVEDNKCPDCGNVHILTDPDTGESFCGKCGLVISDTSIDSGPEWRAFTKEEREDKPRTGIPLTQQIHDQGLSTKIDSSNRDVTGKNLKEKYKWYRLRTWNKRSKVADSNNRNLSRAMEYLGDIKSKLELPDFASENASVLYRKALAKDLIRGNSIRDVMMTCVYMSTRQLDEMDYTINEICNKAGGVAKTIARIYRYLLRELEIDVPLQNPSSIIETVINRLYSKYMPSVDLDMRGNNLGVVALNIIKYLDREKYTHGKSPRGIATPSIYISDQILPRKDGKYGGVFSQEKIAGESDVTEVTIRNRYKEIVEMWGIYGLDDLKDVNKIVETFEKSSKVGNDVSYQELQQEFLDYGDTLDIYLQILEQIVGVIKSYDKDGEDYFTYTLLI